MIFITCALHCEAKPIIERYKLAADREAFFPIFKNENLVLVVTGIGKLLTASAMAYVYARYQEPEYSAWLNVGVAGVKNIELGCLLNVNKVTEISTAINWYPVRLPALSTLPSCALITLDEAGNNYTENDAFDMEASAFMAMALRFSPVELVQIVKVVSDNLQNDMQAVNKQQVTALIAIKLPEIEMVVDALAAEAVTFRENYQNDDLYKECIDKWHFSAYQKKQLLRILPQWQALDGNAGFDQLTDFQSAKHVIAFVSIQLRDRDIYFGEIS